MHLAEGIHIAYQQAPARGWTGFVHKQEVCQCDWTLCLPVMRGKVRLHVVQIPAEDARRQGALLRDARGPSAHCHPLRALVKPHVSEVHSIDAVGKGVKEVAPLCVEEAGVDTDDLVDLQAASEMVAERM